jgi:hypothetical protein
MPYQLIKIRLLPPGLLALAIVLGASACGGSPEPEASPKKTSPPAPISWPAVSSVLDGTDLIEIQDVTLVPFPSGDVSGNYSSEQGGSKLSLAVRRQGETLEVERRCEEPEGEPAARLYQFPTINDEGAVSAQQDAFLRQTKEGLLLLEQRSEVESIPATYWVHYIRQP